MEKWLEKCLRRWEPLAQRLRRSMPIEARVAMIAGSGIAAGLPGVSLWQCPYEELAGFPHPAVEGHPGVIELRRVGDIPVLVFCGRVHLYEGWTLQEVVAPVVVAAHVGVRAIVLTNAAGAISEAVTPGDVLSLRSVLNLTFRSLPIGERVQRFGLLCLEPEWRLRVRQRLACRGVCVPEGVYAAVLGPSYESPAEVRMLERLGADVVGMSTIHELQCATALGIATIAFSLVTNRAAGRQPHALSHEEVLRTAHGASPRLRCVLEAALIEALPG